MQLPSGFVDELRGRISLAQIAGRRVTWDPRKSNAARGDWWAPCPFHQEKTASFHVDDAKGFYYCFGCHAKGDVLDFVRETENVGFMEAVERLAGDAGMQMPAADPVAAARAAANTGLVEAMEAAVRFYRAQLTGSRAAAARAYLERRGLGAETIESFEIGYAPDGRTVLIEHLTAKGFDLAKLVEAGLAGKPGQGSPYDRFRNRITFPIRDARGRAIAFGARAIAPGQEPKYLNSPETPLFDKSRTLYNAGPAGAAARKAGTVIVTEGYMDVIALARAGVTHAVAPLGTAITDRQLEALWKIAPEPVVALDGDTAGLNAAHRLVDLALPHLGAGRSLRFALLPAGQDPDDVVRAGGRAAIEAILADSKPVIDLLWGREVDGQVLDSPERRAALDARLRAHVSRISDATLRAHWEAEVRVRRAALFAPPQKSRPERAFERPFERPFSPGPKRSRRALPVRESFAPATASTRSSLLAQAGEGVFADDRVRESAILAGCLNHPDVAIRLESRLERLACRCRNLEEIRRALLSALADAPDNADRATFVAAVSLRLSRDPGPELSLGQIRSNPHLAPTASPEQAARAIEEELDRHAALAGRAAELIEAAADFAAGPDDGLTERVRAAAEAEHATYIRPLADDGTDTGLERPEFLSVIQASEALLARKPRRR
ncbi:DNA primase [Amaricoccus macauensis]|uniref:DNA primase n=1 Tax=Amaricoccus macauensis TaxID=57001 RepID=A0A840SU25_9RHOB|nr:DNA primase [Amaricoccus macauensis]MBB5224015.1 DNA primase [Amaricoccus macauensis]